jgi:5-methylcytosine-specific restriction endonuclease McrA
MEEKKQCSKCKEFKTLSSFCKDSSRPNGKHPWCSDCRKKRTDQYYKDEKSKIRKRQENYRNLNRELVRENNRASYWRNREKILAHSRIYYRENREKRLAQIKKYRDRNPGYYKNWSRFKYKIGLNLNSKAKKKLVEFLLQKQFGRCYWCNQKLNLARHIDHVIPITRGGTNDIENLVLSCPRCNWSKGNYLPEEWKEVCHLRA